MMRALLLALVLSGCVVAEPEPLTTEVKGLVVRTRFDDVPVLEAVMNTEEGELFRPTRSVVWIGEGPLCSKLSGPRFVDLPSDSPQFVARPEDPNHARQKMLMLEGDGTAYLDTGELQIRRQGTVEITDRREGRDGSSAGRFVAKFVTNEERNTVETLEGAFVATPCTNAQISSCSTGSGLMLLGVLASLLRSRRR